MLGEYCLITLAFLLAIQDCLAIDCYVCTSFADSDILCDDPFDPISHASNIPLYPPSRNNNKNGSYIYLQRNCQGSRKSRLTAFPATACLKLAGHFSDSGEKVVVRACALDGGSLTSDTEIVRQNHCGGFFLNERYVKGCLEACFTDGCNAAVPSFSVHLALPFLMIILVYFVSTIEGTE